MQTEEQKPGEAMKTIFNYDDVFFSFFYDGGDACVHRSREYAMNYVLSGEMVLDNGGRQTLVGKGECVFIPRDHHITMWKRSAGGERYCGIFMMFTRNFLREAYAELPAHIVSADAPRLDPSAVKLPPSAEITSLFESMTPYFDPAVVPHDDVMKLKMREGLLALLHLDSRFAPTLFDFNEPWKIDILAFMNDNYMYELSIEELAHYTGRSPATFKRDFRKISDLTPAKWIMRKRLEAAHAMLGMRGRKVADVYPAVGFKNPSHFSTSFKRRYGISPAAFAERRQSVVGE